MSTSARLRKTNAPVFRNTVAKMTRATNQVLENNQRRNKDIAMTIASMTLNTSTTPQYSSQMKIAPIPEAQQSQIPSATFTNYKPEENLASTVKQLQRILHLNNMNNATNSPVDLEEAMKNDSTPKFKGSNNNNNNRNDGSNSDLWNTSNNNNNNNSSFSFGIEDEAATLTAEDFAHNRYPPIHQSNQARTHGAIYIEDSRQRNSSIRISNNSYTSKPTSSNNRKTSNSSQEDGGDYDDFQNQSNNHQYHQDNSNVEHDDPPQMRSATSILINSERRIESMSALSCSNSGRPKKRVSFSPVLIHAQATDDECCEIPTSMQLIAPPNTMIHTSAVTASAQTIIESAAQHRTMTMFGAYHVQQKQQQELQGNRIEQISPERLRATTVLVTPTSSTTYTTTSQETTRKCEFEPKPTEPIRKSGGLLFLPTSCMPLSFQSLSPAATKKSPTLPITPSSSSTPVSIIPNQISSRSISTMGNTPTTTTSTPATPLLTPSQTNQINASEEGGIYGAMRKNSTTTTTTTFSTPQQQQEQEVNNAPSIIPVVVPQLMNTSPIPYINISQRTGHSKEINLQQIEDDGSPKETSILPQGQEKQPVKTSASCSTPQRFIVDLFSSTCSPYLDSNVTSSEQPTNQSTLSSSSSTSKSTSQQFFQPKQLSPFSSDSHFNTTSIISPFTLTHQVPNNNDQSLFIKKQQSIIQQQQLSSNKIESKTYQQQNQQEKQKSYKKAITLPEQVNFAKSKQQNSSKNNLQSNNNNSSSFILNEKSSPQQKLSVAVILNQSKQQSLSISQNSTPANMPHPPPPRIPYLPTPKSSCNTSSQNSIQLSHFKQQSTTSSASTAATPTATEGRKIPSVGVSLRSDDSSNSLNQPIQSYLLQSQQQQQLLFQIGQGNTTDLISSTLSSDKSRDFLQKHSLISQTSNSGQYIENQKPAFTTPSSPSLSLSSDFFLFPSPGVVPSLSPLNKQKEYIQQIASTHDKQSNCSSASTPSNQNPSNSCNTSASNNNNTSGINLTPTPCPMPTLLNATNVGSSGNSQYFASMRLFQMNQRVKEPVQHQSLNAMTAEQQDSSLNKIQGTIPSSNNSRGSITDGRKQLPIYSQNSDRILTRNLPRNEGRRSQCRTPSNIRNRQSGQRVVTEGDADSYSTQNPIPFQNLQSSKSPSFRKSGTNFTGLLTAGAATSQGRNKKFEVSPLRGQVVNTSGGSEVRTLRGNGSSNSISGTTGLGAPNSSLKSLRTSVQAPLKNAVNPHSHSEYYKLTPSQSPLKAKANMLSYSHFK